MYPKNAASPPPFNVGQVVQISDGVVQTAGASARVKIGTGAWGAAANTPTCDVTSGFWEYTPSQAETNATSFQVAVYKSGCLGCGQTIVTTDTATAGRVALVSAGTGDVSDIKSGLATPSNILGAAVPGAYGAGTLGKLIGDYMDAAISSRGTGTALDAAGVRTAVGLSSANLATLLGDIAGYLDTEIAAILAAVDTEIAAIITHLTDIKGATWAGATDSLEAIRDRGDAAWLTATGFALATVCTEGRLAELDAANIPADIDTLLTRLSALRAGYLDKLNVAGSLLPTAADVKIAIEAVGSSLALILEDTGTTLPGTLQIIDDFLDTEIAVIKDKTDQLTFTTPNSVDASASVVISPEDITTIANEVASSVSGALGTAVADGIALAEPVDANLTLWNGESLEGLFVAVILPPIQAVASQSITTTQTAAVHITQGNDIILPISIALPPGSTWSGWTAHFAAKLNVSDSNYWISPRQVTFQGSSGSCSVSLSNTDTKTAGKGTAELELRHTATGKKFTAVRFPLVLDQKIHP